MIFKERKILKILSGVLFTSSLSILIILVSMASVTEYDNLKPVFSSLIIKSIPSDQLSQYYKLVLISCEKSQTIDIPLGVERITLKCNDVRAAGQEGFSALVASELFDKIYYKEYSCSFIDCVKQSPVAILSQKANTFINDAMYVIIILTIVSSLIFAVSMRGWGIAKGFGTSLIFVGLSYFVIVLFKSMIPAQIMQVGGEFINSILDSIAFNFLIVLLAGIIITASWFVFGRKTPKKK